MRLRSWRLQVGLFVGERETKRREEWLEDKERETVSRFSLLTILFTASLSPLVPCHKCHGKPPAMLVKLFAKQKQNKRKEKLHKFRATRFVTSKSNVITSMDIDEDLAKF